VGPEIIWLQDWWWEKVIYGSISPDCRWWDGHQLVGSDNLGVVIGPALQSKPTSEFLDFLIKEYTRNHPCKQLMVKVICLWKETGKKHNPNEFPPILGWNVFLSSF
jgi:hypothetical protein